ncbi:MAG: DUF882 domain-containing protein [Deltaproteobacteria bacterium]|nr:DUF882 domain-containing protein [Deltaproteobacteria bacterium]
MAVCLFAAAPVIAVAAFPSPAEAEVTHVVQKGDKLDDLAKKYGVTAKAIATANKLKDPTHLKAGVKLKIPGATVAKTYEAKPKHPGKATFVRFGTSESMTLQLVNKKGKLVPGVLPRMARVMRFGKLNIEHPIDSRLIQLVAQVSDHFGGRTIEIVSGFRPKTPTQYTPHSNHNVGKAIDMRVAGVPNEIVRDHCRTYKNVGVGYYPNSLFVHFDVRAKSTFWVDLSKPGEAPKYVGANTDVDHGVDDVDDIYGSDAPPSASAAPSTAPVSSAGAVGAPPLGKTEKAEEKPASAEKKPEKGPAPAASGQK